MSQPGDSADADELCAGGAQSRRSPVVVGSGLDRRPRRHRRQLALLGTLSVLLLLIGQPRPGAPQSDEAPAGRAGGAEAPAGRPGEVETGEGAPQESPDAIIQQRSPRPSLDHAAIEARRQEQERLEEYLAGHGDDHETRISLARVMATRRFLNEAIRQLDRVIKADSTRVDVWRLRAGWYRELGLVRGEPKLLGRALASYQAMIRLGGRLGGDVDAERRVQEHDLIAAAGLALALNEIRAAAAFAGQIGTEGSAATVAALLLAAADYKDNRVEEAARVIDHIRATTRGPLIDALDGYRLAGIAGDGAAERLATSATSASSGVTSISPGGADGGTPGGAAYAILDLACPGLAGPAPIVADGSIGARLAGFWKSQDPTPTTSMNERYLEHCYRVMVADALYSRAGLPGRDSDRGGIFIRYGRPDQQAIEGGKMITSFAPRRSNVRPTESHDGMQRHMYGDPSMQLEFPRIAWQYEVGKETLLFQFEDLTLQGDFYYTHDTAVRSRAVAKALPSLYKREVPGGLVQVAETQTRFRGLRDDVVVSLAVAIPAVRVAPEGEERSAWDEVEVRWAVFDPAYRGVARSAMQLTDPRCAYRDAGGRVYLLARADFDLPVGDYIMAIEFQDRRTGKEGIVKRDMKVEPITGILSEIELCREVQRAAPGSERPFVRYDAVVVPNPRNEVATGDPLRFYYEVYRLQRTPEGNRRCRIQHRVRSMNEPKGARPIFPLAHSIDIDEPVGRYDTYMPRVGQLDVSTLRVGRYELQVQVEDLVSGRIETRAIRFLRRP